MTAPSAAQARDRNIGYYRYLNQGEIWLPKDKPSLPIADMDDAWRANAAAWLERRAETFALYYTLGEIEALAQPIGYEVLGEVDGETYLGRGVSQWQMMGDSVRDGWDDAMAERDRDPQAWIRTTPLYRALVAGLPYPMRTLGAQLEAVAA